MRLLWLDLWLCEPAITKGVAGCCRRGLNSGEGAGVARAARGKTRPWRRAWRRAAPAHRGTFTASAVPLVRGCAVVSLCARVVRVGSLRVRVGTGSAEMPSRWLAASGSTATRICGRTE